MRALVTGCRTGLGHALADVFLGEGAQVYGVSRGMPEDLVDRDGFRFVSCDLAEHDTIPARLAALLSDATALDLVVLNAGVLGGIRDLRETSLDALRHVLDVNLFANKVVIDALLARLETVGHVIAISSGAAVNASGGWGPYAISKASLNALVSAYADEHPATHFNAVAPGVFDSSMTREIRSRPADARHPANARVRAAFEEGRAWSPEVAARHLVSLLAEIRSTPSGAFVDVRDLLES